MDERCQFLGMTDLTMRGAVAGSRTNLIPGSVSLKRGNPQPDSGPCRELERNRHGQGTRHGILLIGLSALIGASGPMMLALVGAASWPPDC